MGWTSAAGASGKLRESAPSVSIGKIEIHVYSDPLSLSRSVIKQENIILGSSGKNSHS